MDIMDTMDQMDIVFLNLKSMFLVRCYFGSMILNSTIMNYRIPNTEYYCAPAQFAQNRDYGLRITSTPPIYGCKAFGINIDPSAC